MAVLNRMRALLDRPRAEDLLPPLAISDGQPFDLEGDGADTDAHEPLIYLQGNDQRAFLGAVWIGEPLSGLDETTVRRLQGTMSAEFRPGTIIQIQQIVSPFIEPIIDLYAGARTKTRIEGKVPQVIMNTSMHRAEMFLDGRETPMIESNDIPTNSAMIVVSIKVPCGKQPKAAEMKEINDTAMKLAEGLSTVGLRLHRVGAGPYLAICRRLLRIRSPHDESYNDELLLRDQILQPGDNIVVRKDHLLINDTELVRILSVKQYPKQTNLGVMGHLIGDPGGINNQITVPYTLTLTMHYPEQSKRSASIRTKAQSINYQAYGPMLRFIPILAAKKEGFDVLIKEMDEGAVIVEASLTLALYSDEKHKLEKMTGMVRAYYSSFGFEMSEERYITWPVFWHTFPLFPAPESIKQLYRFRTMAVKHAVQFFPIIGEWQGTGVGGASIYLTRRGKPMLIDFYDSPTNYNGIIFAESGAGKSYLSQQIIQDYLSIGAKVWVMDVGRSYLKQNLIYGGEFIEFSEQSHACLNPFTNVDDIDDEMDVLKAILAKMAAPTDHLDDFRMAALGEAIKATWGAIGRKMTVTEVAAYLKKQSDQRIADLATMLFPFTRNGEYGSWFDGPNNLHFNRDYVVLELEELNGKKHLQQVVLLMLVSKIQHEMFISELKGEGRKKLLVVDEAWSLLNDPGVAKFLETGYRRFRKSLGSALICTQSLDEFYASPSGRAIAANSAFYLIMQQKAESIVAVKDSKRLDLDEYTMDQLKTVHTVSDPKVAPSRRYSECMFYTPRGIGIGRLVVDPVSQVIYSSSGDERAVLLREMRSGMSPEEAMQKVTDFMERKKQPLAAA